MNSLELKPTKLTNPTVYVVIRTFQFGPSVGLSDNSHIYIFLFYFFSHTHVHSLFYFVGFGYSGSFVAVLLVMTLLEDSVLLYVKVSLVLGLGLSSYKKKIIHFASKSFLYTLFA